MLISINESTQCTGGCPAFSLFHSFASTQPAEAICIHTEKIPGHENKGFELVTALPSVGFIPAQ